MATIVSIQVGKPASYGSADAANPHDQSWTTGFYKRPVMGSVWASRANLAGDGQADLKHHGGADKAVLAYSTDHYPYWKDHLDRSDLPFGAFGENLSVAGIAEAQVAIGDVWQVGPVVFQVSQPRQPCWKLSRRWRIDDLARQVIENGKSGWYLRVLTEGSIAAGAELVLVERPNPAWTVARASRLMHHDKHDLAGAAELASLPELSASWKKTLTDRLAKRTARKEAPFD